MSWCAPLLAWDGPQEFLFVDGSNLFLTLQRTAGAGDSRPDSRARVNLPGLLEAVRCAPTAQKKVYCSTRGDLVHDDPARHVWATFEEHGFQVSRHGRGSDGREKEVDTQLVADMVEAALACPRVSTVIKLVSGDRDMWPGVEKALAQPHCSVELYGLSSGTAALYLDKASKSGGRLRVASLDSTLWSIIAINWSLHAENVAELLTKGRVGFVVERAAGSSTCLSLHGLNLSQALTALLQVPVRVMPSPASAGAWFAVTDKSCKAGDVAAALVHGFSNSDSQLRWLGLSSWRWLTDEDTAPAACLFAPKLKHKSFVARKQCWHGARCPKGTECTFLHTAGENELFRNQKAAREAVRFPSAACEDVWFPSAASSDELKFTFPY